MPEKSKKTIFKPLSSKLLHRQVFEHIQEMVMSGELSPGDRLPSERDMSEMFKVSRNSVREALKALEILGILECRQGGGNYIKCDISAGIIEPLSILFKLHKGRFTDLLEARRALEAEAASLAASRISSEETAVLEDLMKRIRSTGSEKESVALDKELHLKIAAYSGNIMLLAFLTAISSMLETAIKDGRKAIMSTFKDREQLFDAHEEICRAIINHDKDAASAAVNKHFKMILDNI